MYNPIRWTSSSDYDGENSLSIGDQVIPESDTVVFDLTASHGDFVCSNLSREAAREVIDRLTKVFGFDADKQPEPEVFIIEVVDTYVIELPLW